MANPTTNYGFVLPTPTDLVTDLPADFDVALQGVDTQMLTNANAATAKATLTAKGGIYAATAASTPAFLPVGTNGQVLTADSSAATGLKYSTVSSAFVLVKARTAFSGVATTGSTFDSVFSATYSNYIIIIDQFSSSVQANGLFQFRNGGTTRSGSDYYAGRQSVSWDGASTASGGAGTTSIILSSMAAGANISNYQITYFHPNTSSNNSKIAFTGYSPQLQGGLYGGAFTNASGNNDGFILSASSGNITGNATVYGLAAS